MLTNRERAFMDEWIAADSALSAATGPECQPLVVQLSNCSGAAMLLGEERVLRIVGMLLAQEGLGDVFEHIYAAVNDAFEGDPGDGRKWLQQQVQ